MKTLRIVSPVLFAVLLALGGCAGSGAGGGGGGDEVAQTDGDPLEKFNRKMLNFNFKVDRFVLKPTAKVYAKLPGKVRTGIGNFFSNLRMPGTIINDVLQGKLVRAGGDTGRFVINSTLGLFGIFDVAKLFGLEPHREDFGQTLAVWGVPAGPYLVLPFLGPGNLRDAAALTPQYLANDSTKEVLDPVSALPSPEAEVATGLRLVHLRAGLLGADDILDVQPDRYLFLRESYRQRRAQQIYDGKPPVDSDDEDALLDELLDEFDDDEDAQ